MARIIISQFVATKMDALIDTLYESGYFVVRENAVKYVGSLRDFINTIPSQRKHATANNLHGEWYCEFKANKHTTWFITFDLAKETYLIKNLINNHTKDYPTLIKSR